MIAKSRWILAGAVGAVCMYGVATAAEGHRNFHVVNRLRLEYDDNIYTTETEEQDSYKIIEQIDLSYNVNLENTFLSLRYSPSLVWWDNRPEDDTDFSHSFDGTVNHALSPRSSISLKDTLRISDRPEQVLRESVIREDNTFLYNALVGSYSYLLAEATRAEIAGRWVNLSYDEDEVADRSNYDIYVGGLTLRHTKSPETALLGDFRWEGIDYKEEGRDSTTLYFGGGLEHTFNPTFLGSLRAGYQNRNFEDTVKNSTDTPYADGSLTFLPSPATRVTTGLSYSQYEASVSPFASTERTRLFLSLAHDLTARIAGYLSGSFTENRYDSKETVTGDVVDGDEQWWQLSARSTYEINRSNFVEVGYQYTDVESEVQSDYKRNRINVGWVLKI